jgi:hypothetical protein
MEPPKLDIKMDAKKMVYIRNAVIKEASSPAELMELFNLGNVERHTGKNKNVAPRVFYYCGTIILFTLPRVALRFSPRLFGAMICVVLT